MTENTSSWIVDMILLQKDIEFRISEVRSSFEAKFGTDEEREESRQELLELTADLSLIGQIRSLLGVRTFSSRERIKDIRKQFRDRHPDMDRLFVKF